MNALVGYTGFVGSNLAKNGTFSALYNSKNIGEAFNLCPDVLFYSGLPAEKFLADKFPEKDRAKTDEAAQNILRINPKRVVLISTVDVYEVTDGKTESMIDGNESRLPYGANRLELERFVAKNFEHHHIVRLPGLFGVNLKKNFIYDFISFIPAMLNEQKITEIGNIRQDVYSMYTLQENGFYKLSPDADRERARELFCEVGFSALNFTDSRAVFQFYNLANLFSDINTAITNEIKTLNLATEPISAASLYHHLTGESFVNELPKNPPYYNFKSEHCEVFAGKAGYLYTAQQVLTDIANFVKEGV